MINRNQFTDGKDFVSLQLPKAKMLLKNTRLQKRTKMSLLLGETFLSIHFSLSPMRANSSDFNLHLKTNRVFVFFSVTSYSIVCRSQKCSFTKSDALVRLFFILVIYFLLQFLFYSLYNITSRQTTSFAFAARAVESYSLSNVYLINGRTYC